MLGVAERAVRLKQADGLETTARREAVAVWAPQEQSQQPLLVWLLPEERRVLAERMAIARQLR